MNFCTIITKQYLAHARVLAKSILAANPSAEVYVLIADTVDGSFHPSTEPFHTVLLQDLGHRELVTQMAFYYGGFEFCCALRGLLHEYMWLRTQAKSWVYLDSDICVMHDLAEVFERLSSASLLLNPHNVATASDAFVEMSESAALRCGIFNAGFLGVRRCDQSAKFISWFKSRLSRYCFLPLPGMFVDQLWLNHVPQYFREVAIYTNPGANLGPWNLFQRTITGDLRSGYLVDGQPLLFVHFSGLNFGDPGDVSRHYPYYQKLPRDRFGAWFDLTAHYRQALLANGYTMAAQLPYAFDRFDNGAPIDSEMRFRQYKDVWSGVPQRVSPFARGEDFKNEPA